MTWHYGFFFAQKIRSTIDEWKRYHGCLLHKTKDLNKQIVFVEEVVVNSLIVQKILVRLPESYQEFASMLKKIIKSILNAVKVDVSDNYSFIRRSIHKK